MRALMALLAPWQAAESGEAPPPAPAPVTTSPTLSNIIGGSTISTVTNLVINLFSMRLRSSGTGILGMTDQPGDAPQFASLGDTGEIARDDQLTQTGRDNVVRDVGKSAIWASAGTMLVRRNSAGDGYRGKVSAFAFGVDTPVGSDIRIGICVPLQSSDIDINFNQSYQSAFGVGFAPYAARQFAPEMTFDVETGYLWLNFEERIADGRGEASFNGHRWFTNGRVTWDREFGDYGLRLSGMYSHVHETKEAGVFTNRVISNRENTDIGQASVEARIGYRVDEWTVPYVSVRAEHELFAPDRAITSFGESPDDRTGGRVGAGIIAHLAPSTRIAVDLSTAVLRQDTTDHRLMGSRFTEDSDGMRAVLAGLSACGLIFLDSRTSPASVVPALRREFPLPVLSCDVFLDDDPSPASVRAALAEVEATALRQGHAIAIGHPRDATLDELAGWLPTLALRGLRLVPVSALAAQRLTIGWRVD
ncbi:MAG: autotransporter domain-containing protein [Alphaproteobacteria bacterium]|nr:autotransporter domain-containing protein [Alphaproteobacteria bacterium]